ncbi:MAG TPA: alpha/beta fold hydrolase [Candidatus Angelobacter sp.]
MPIRSSGTATPLFLVHPVGGGIIAFHDLAKYLRAEHPVYALQNLDSGNDVEQEPLSIEKMAGRYIKAIQTVSPQGPYFLGGSSMGGAVAFEMAVQLKAQNQPVSLVAMLDTPAKVISHIERETRHSVHAIELTMFTSSILSGSQTNFHINLADLDPLQPAEQIDFVFRRLQQHQLVPVTLSSSEFEIALRAFANNLNAFERYMPPAYDGRVAILRARDTSANLKQYVGDLDRDLTFGWQAHCTQPVTVRFVPGDHMLMNLEPNVRFTAAELQRVLDEGLSVLEGLSLEGH